jgi:hypothetical protein
VEKRDQRQIKRHEGFDGRRDVSVGDGASLGVRAHARGDSSSERNLAGVGRKKADFIGRAERLQKRQSGTSDHEI